MSTITILSYSIALLMFAIPVLLSIMIYKTNFRENAVKVLDGVTTIVDGKLKQKKEGYFSYDRLENYLTKVGARDMAEWINPFGFVAIKIIAALLFFFIGLSALNVLLGFVLMIVSFYALDLVFYISNESDNEKMISDIKKVYDTLRIQTKAGVYLTDSLCECYLAVKTKRLKVALWELTNTIHAEKNIYDALDVFNAKFDNRYIDTFCITIRQSLESGKSVQILSDLSKQISDMQKAIAIKEKEKLDRKIQFFQLLVFVGLIAICIYCLGIEIFTSIGNF